MALWNLSGRSGQSSHTSFSDLIRSQLYRSVPDPHEPRTQIRDTAEDDIGNGRPASAAVIESLIAMRIISETGHISSCAICRDVLHPQDRIIELPCYHQYHADCILPWLSRRNTCPICRYELPTDDDQYDTAREAIRRVELSPERSSSITIIDGASETGNISDIDSESVVTEVAALNFEELDLCQDRTSQSELHHQNDHDADQEEEEEEGGILQFLSGSNNLPAHADDIEYEERDNIDEGLCQDPNLRSLLIETELSQSSILDLVNVEVQHQLNTHIGILHSQISHLEQRLNQVVSAFKSERTRHVQLQNRLNDLETYLLKSDSSDRYENVQQHLRQEFQQLRKLLHQRLDL